MRWSLALLLRPVTFVLSIVAAVLTGDRTGSFFLGLLAFFVGLGAGRALRALVRGRARRAVDRLVWPAAATGYAFLFAWLGLPGWADFLVSFVAASLTKRAVPSARGRSAEQWGLPTLDDVVPGRSRRL